ncbi:MAG: glycosyltransferase family 39 protein, partial [Elusimicrobiota bacterium]|nr:glycosyltransferase family 39 protein [Elusimicrobiota bacterium]
MSLRTKDKVLLWVLLAALLLRVGFALMCEHALYPDEHSWNALSQALLAGKGFINHLRPPGYISFLAAVYKVFGAGNMTAVRLTQALLGTAQAAFIYFLTLKIFRKRLTACIAAAAVAFYPYLIFYSAHILSETLYSFLLVSSVFYIYSMGDDDESPVSSIAAGVLASLAVLTKATVLAVFPVLIVWFALNKIDIRKIVFFFAAAAIIITPWSMKNYLKYGAVVPVTPSGSYFFQAYNKETMRLEEETRRLKDVEWYTDEYNEIAEQPVIEADREYRRRAVVFMKQNPLVVLRLMLLRFVHFWRPAPITKNKMYILSAFISSA